MRFSGRDNAVPNLKALLSGERPILRQTQRAVTRDPHLYGTFIAGAEQESPHGAKLMFKSPRST